MKMEKINFHLNYSINLVPPKKFTLEQTLEFIKDDELVEITLVPIRLRKKILNDKICLKEE